MTRCLAGSRILITGATGGIGQALAIEAGRRGAQVALVGRTADQLEKVAAALPPGEALTIQADVTSPEDRQRILDTIIQKWGGLDVLVNNAGVASFAHFAESSEEVLRQIMEVNFFAPAELMRAAVPLLSQSRQPAIVNVASMCGRRGVPAWSEYSASKFALTGLTEALRAEFARFDIDLLLVLPGLTRTGLRRNLLRTGGRMKIDLDKGMTPDDVARSILSALERNRKEIVLGSDARWILRIHRWFPRLVDYLMARKVRKLYAVGAS